MRNAKCLWKEFAMAGPMSRSLHGLPHASEGKGGRERGEGVHVGFRGDSHGAAP